MDILNRLQALMQERQWSKYQLGKQAGLSQSVISNLFNRNNAPTISTLKSICGALDITMAQLFLEDETVAYLSEEQAALLAAWSGLSKETKAILLDLIKNIGK